MKKLYLLILISLSGCNLISDNSSKVMNTKCLFGRSFEVEIRNGVMYSEKMPIPLGFVQVVDKNKILFSREVDDEVKRYILDVKKDGSVYVASMGELEFFRCR